MAIIDGVVARSRRSLRSCRRKSGRLPDDIVFCILLCLPVDVIYYVMRLVCKGWNKIIQSPSFISCYLKRSLIGIFISQVQLTVPHIRNIRKLSSDHVNGNVEVKVLNRKIFGGVRASCNGLVFVLGPEIRKRRCPCYIANLVTKQHLPLPLIPIRIVVDKYLLAYAVASGVYKVFYPGYKKYLILTVGVDKKWRVVDGSQVTSYTHSFSYSHGISLRGFLYWIQVKLVSEVLEVHGIICLDIESETFRTHLPLPLECQNVTCRVGLLAKDTSLCVWKQLSGFSFGLWLLKDQDSETGHVTWENLGLIDLTDQRSVISEMLSNTDIDSIHPYGWLQRGELLVLGAQGIIGAPQQLFIYYVNTGEFYQSEELNSGDSYQYFNSYAHVDSLVPINNLSLATERSPKMFKCRAKVYNKDNMRAEFDESN